MILLALVFLVNTIAVSFLPWWISIWIFAAGCLWRTSWRNFAIIASAVYTSWVSVYCYFLYRNNLPILPHVLEMVKISNSFVFILLMSLFFTLPAVLVGASAVLKRLH